MQNYFRREKKNKKSIFFYLEHFEKSKELKVSLL